MDKGIVWSLRTVMAMLVFISANSLAADEPATNATAPAGTESAAQRQTEQAKERRLEEAILEQVFIQNLDEIAAASKKKKERYSELREKYKELGLPGYESYPSAAPFSAAHEKSIVSVVFFDPESSYLTVTQKDKLDNIVDILADQAAINIIIEGYSASNFQIEEKEKRGHYNYRIAGRRAVKVMDYLTKRGVAETRIATFSRGNEKIYRKNKNGDVDENYNRRVELRFSNRPITPYTGRKAKPKAKSSPLIKVGS